MLTQEERDRRHNYHAPDTSQQAKYERLRAEFKELSLTIDTLVPDSREKSVALTQLETAQFWANAGIARAG